MGSAEREAERTTNRFDLNLIRVLYVLLEERNVTHAAERLCVSQPAMSGALQRLREYFKDQLLVRAGREMELTPLARSLIEPVRELLLSIRETLDTRPRFDARTTKRAFSLAMSDYAALVLMPRVLKRLAEKAPYISCHVEPLIETTFAKLSSNDVELCVGSDNWRLYGNLEPKGEIRSSPLFTDEFVCVVDRDNPLVGDTLSAEHYKQMPHAAVRLCRGFSSVVEHAWTLADLNLNIMATAPSFSTLMFMVPGTPLIATTQARLARILAQSLPLKQVPCPIPMPRLTEVLIWHARNDFDPGHDFLRAIIVEAASQIDAPQPRELMRGGFTTARADRTAAATA